jgi:hypothetical protein
MTTGRRGGRAALGFSVHTGWAAMVAVSGPATSAAVLDRRRLEMIPGASPESPRFVYHAARELLLEPAERLIRESAELSRERAKAALQAVVEELETRGYQAVAVGIVVGDGPRSAALETILKSHSLVHAAEGELFREAIRSASRMVGLSVAEVRTKDLYARAATALGVSDGKVAQHLARIGSAAGKPWAKDQKEACLAALIALSS